jgi:hypothetical protein
MKSDECFDCDCFARSRTGAPKMRTRERPTLHFSSEPVLTVASLPVIWENSVRKPPGITSRGFFFSARGFTASAGPMVDIE